MEILKALPGMRKESLGIAKKMAEGLPLYSAGYVDEFSLYTKPKKREHQPLAEEQVSVTEDEIREETDEFKKRLLKVYSHQKVLRYILEQLGDRYSLTTEELRLASDDEFIKLLLAVMKNDEKGLPYRVEFKEGYLYVDGYRLPELVIAREARSADVGK